MEAASGDRRARSMPPLICDCWGAPMTQRHELTRMEQKLLWAKWPDVPEEPPMPKMLS